MPVTCFSNRHIVSKLWLAFADRFGWGVGLEILI
jgi:hypothetical protein